MLLLSDDDHLITIFRQCMRSRLCFAHMRTSGINKRKSFILYLRVNLWAHTVRTDNQGSLIKFLQGIHHTDTFGLQSLDHLRIVDDRTERIGIVIG